MTWVRKAARLWAALAAALIFAPAAVGLAQAVMQQLGPVTNGHLLMGVGNGQLMDAGGPSQMNQPPQNSALPGTRPTGLGIVNSGLGNCQWSAYASGPYTQFCWGFDGNGNALLSVSGLGGTLAPSFNINLNGTTYPFPGAGNGNVIAPTSPFPAAGDAAVWNGSTAVRDGTGLSFSATDPTLSGYASWSSSVPFYPGKVKYEPACTGLAAHDDAIVTDAFTWAAANSGKAVLSGATCAFTTPVAAATSGGVNGATVDASGAALVYSGASTTTDLIKFGADTPSALSYRNTFENFRLSSSVTMGGGYAFRLIGCMNCTVQNVIIGDDAVQGAGKDYNGLGLQSDNSPNIINVSSSAINDAVDVWSPDAQPNPSVSNTFIGGTFAHSAVGLRLGGGGNAIIVNSDILLNGVNVQADNTLSSVPNAQLVLQDPSALDTATNYNVLINEAVAQSSQQIVLDGWDSNSQGAANVRIQQCPNCQISIAGQTIYASGYGIEIDDATAQVQVGGWFTNNGGPSGADVYCSASMNQRIAATFFPYTTRPNVKGACVNQAVNTGFATTASPPGTSSTTFVMTGLAMSLIPQYTGTVIVNICGQAANAVSGAGGNLQIYYGTGAAPTNGAAVTGTAAPYSTSMVSPVASGNEPYCLMGRLTGLTDGTAYWFDVAQASSAAGDAFTQHNVSGTVQELH